MVLISDAFRYWYPIAGSADIAPQAHLSCIHNSFFLHICMHICIMMDACKQDFMHVFIMSPVTQY